MDKFIELDSLGKTLFFAVQGFFILFWIVSPLGGLLWARAIRNHTTMAIIFGLLIVMFNGLFVGVTYLLQQRYSVADNTAVAIALGFAGVVTSLAGALLIYLYRDEATPIQQEREFLKAVDNIEDLSFQARRQQRIHKRRR